MVLIETPGLAPGFRAEDVFGLVFHSISSAGDLLSELRDPRYEDPNTSGLPPLNPARFLPQRHILLGLSFDF